MLEKNMCSKYGEEVGLKQIILHLVKKRQKEKKSELVEKWPIEFETYTNDRMTNDRIQMIKIILTKWQTIKNKNANDWKCSINCNKKLQLIEIAPPEDFDHLLLCDTNYWTFLIIRELIFNRFLTIHNSIICTRPIEFSSRVK